MSTDDMSYGDVQFSILPMNCKRVRIRALTKCKDDTLWEVHKDLDPDFIDYDVSTAVHMLFLCLVKRAQSESS